MLLSLDQFSSIQDISSTARRFQYDPLLFHNQQPPASPSANPSHQLDGPDHPLPRASASRDRDRRGGHTHAHAHAHAHSYNYSSDLDNPIADDSSRYSSQGSRGRRSNSSSNFPSGLARISSLRDASHRSSPASPHRPLHSRGGRGSKGSSSVNSIDAAGYPHAPGGQRRVHDLGHRSSSFDYGHRPATTLPLPQPRQQQQIHHQQTAHPTSNWPAHFSDTFLADDYDDAAPTPTIPAGPRRIPALSTSASNPSFARPPPTEIPVPRPPTATATATAPDRKRSPRSGRSMSMGRKPETQYRKNMAHDPMPQKSPAPVFADMDSAPAPHVGYEKTKEPVHPAASSPPTLPVAQTKDKPGFFRRVFGSSRNNAANNPTSTRPPPAAVRTDSSLPNATATLSKSESTPPSRDHSTSHSHHGVLQKKPSSFFRRRKKSFAEESPPVPATPVITSDRPPVPPIEPRFQLLPDEDVLADDQPVPSPVSSLRKVMNPYLKASPMTPAGEPHPFHTSVENAADSAPEAVETPEPESREYKRSFSPDYEPSPNARIRKVKPESRDGDEGDGHDMNRQAQRELERESESQHDHKFPAETPTRRPPNIPKPTGHRSDSFLNLEGSDDNEGDPDWRNNLRSRNEKARTPTGEPSGEESPSLSPKGQRKNSTNGAGMSMSSQNPAGTADANTKRRSTLVLPIEGAQSEMNTPTVHIEDSSASPPSTAAKGTPFDEPDFVVGDPTDDDRQKAQKIFDGHEDYIQKDKAAAWMGEEGPIRQRTLRAYMDLYDFTNKSIVQGLRLVCERLVFRAETQQVDRILVAFSRRWCECNPNHGFKATDVVHTICYSIMLLNTDLHIADIEQKMTRSQFVRNTMTTITQAATEAAPKAFRRPSLLTEKNEHLATENPRGSTEERSNRFSFRPAPRRDISTDEAEREHDTDSCGPLVKVAFDGTLRAWEAQVELVLKDIYASIRDERLPLFGAAPEPQRGPPGGLSVMGMLKRSPSVLSKAPSESQTSLRGCIAESTRSGTGRFSSKSRSRPRLANPGFSSSRTSFDDGNSLWSPASSSATWSRYSLGRTQTSMSVDSFGGSALGGGFQQSIGFANALSQAIIRDDASSSHGHGLGPAPSAMSDEAKATLLDDESLELSGPPWVKEGMVTHKHHLDGVDKKAKDRNWTEVFAVVQKGQMSLFSFSPNKSLGRKSRAARNAAKANPAGVVGGGNWQENATNLATFNLRQTLASALPSPGYSRSRPYVWALSLPTGAVHLFQVGTPEISKEFVTTANYWSARLSTHPLVGGISNVEYGWSDSIVNNALVAAINESTGNQPPSTRSSRRGSVATAHHRNNSSGNANGAVAVTAQGRSSMQSSSRSLRSASFDYGFSPSYTSRGGKLPGDRIPVSEWTAPAQSMRPSNLSEREQLASLMAYVKGIEEELLAHNKLRSPMLLAFTPRSHSANKAMANWERKSSYLLRESVKFRTYVDCLQQAEARRAEIYAERELAQRAARGELSDEEVEGHGDVTLP
ncbi:hypothetical protein SODALDRAFT_324447 [Sodiomyces alkalinus F11]|uniref:SEC7 domain-containing protein n=1 Tax=Sodiomyces alkalinus (strain CBS 110278 / VKM F-3762 / F11) TaxID=1314773 RepID=A0A3N2PU28_SODAK|nr:hypothetical protein SODALDRAFT_324447 [Sodiomyces alkalinus F11]ROT37991.1 hypothetical protein SODALDRAFT_324447 [Sodiomyces alkalinus F11]